MSIFGYIIGLVALFATLQNEVQAEGRFLVGTTTPVWLASAYGQRMQYERLGETIMKEAIESVSTNPSSSPPSSNETYKSLTVLVMMEYPDKVYPSDAKGQKDFIYYFIRHAVAFWNEVNRQLNEVIKNPGVQIRIAGIVIPKNLYAFSKSEHRSLLGGRTIKAHDTIKGLVYGFKPATSYQLDPRNFNVVAVMSRYSPAWLFNKSWSFRFNWCERNSGLFFYEDEYGIERAVTELAYIMGRGKQGDSAYQYSNTAQSFTSNELDQIRGRLNRMSCWKKPIENWPPGKPLPTIYRSDVE